jgi:RNA polymerase sigma factor (sigma-70 family)
LNEVLSVNDSVAATNEFDHGGDVHSWSDALLVSAIRSDPPNEQALDVLVHRYWKSLFGRCRILALNHEKARDLAQQVWARLLKARHRLKPDGNLPAYLTTIATNLWRDSYRAVQRAGPMADTRLASLDTAITIDEGETSVLSEVLPDPKSLNEREQTLLRIDLDQALEQLTPLLRDVLVARFIAGDSCAEIGRRHRRTEQTISAWIREGIQQMKAYFETKTYRGNDDERKWNE